MFTAVSQQIIFSADRAILVSLFSKGLTSIQDKYVRVVGSRHGALDFSGNRGLTQSGRGVFSLSLTPHRCQQHQTLSLGFTRLTVLLLCGTTTFHGPSFILCSQRVSLARVLARTCSSLRNRGLR